MVIVKSTSNSQDWRVFHTSYQAGKTSELNQTRAATQTGGPPPWRVGDHVFGAKNGQIVDNGYAYIAYCFNSIEGYSAIGSYTGNGSTNGPFVYTGFRVAFLLFKNISTAQNWFIYDTTRDPENPNKKFLRPNLANIEATISDGIDLLSNGFKMRQASASHNENESKFLYAAFAENPFKTARAR